MRRKYLHITSALVAALTLGGLTTSRAKAWDAPGHMQVADIAWSKLTPHAKGEIKAILMQGDPKFRPASESDADVRAAFRKASTYADVIKGDRTTQYEETIQKMNPLFFLVNKPDPMNREHELCKTWHYYDAPIRDKGNHPPETSNALNALNLAEEQIAKLQAGAEKDRKMQCWWLYWVEHIVGDLHQPLHCVSNYEYSDQGDAGGNRVEVVLDPAKGDRKNRLHGYWDGGIARAIGEDREKGLSPNVEDVTQRWSADAALKPSDKDAADLDVTSWIANGAKLAEAVVYKDIKKDAPIPSGYAAAQIRLCRQQAVLAGTRLANVLNLILDK